MSRITLRVCLLTTLTTASAIAQNPPSKASKASKAAVLTTKAAPDTSKPTASTLITGMLQQLVARPFRAPSPCAGAPTLTHGRHADSIPVPELRKMPVSRAQTLLARMHLNVDVRAAAVTGQPGTVIAQSPPNTEYVASGDVIIVCTVAPSVVDTAFGATGSTVSKVPRVRMPPLVGKTYTIATAALSKVLQLGQLRPPVGVTGLPRQKVDPARIIVASQRPDPGTVLTSTDSIVLAFRDTTTIIKQTPVVQMPRLVDSSYATATATLERLFQSGNLKLGINHRGVNGQAVDTTRSLVADQTPTAGTMLTQGTTIMLVLRDTTTPIKPQTVVVRMPSVTDSAYSTADRILTELFQANKLSIGVTIRSTAAQPRRLASSIVIRQLPPAGSTLTPQSRVELFLRDTAKPAAPPPQRVRMIALKGKGYTVAVDTLNKLFALGGLGLTTDVRWPNNATRVIARSMIDSQSPPAGTILTARSVVRLYARDTTTTIAAATVRDTTPIVPQPTDGWALWKKVAAALAVLLAGAAILNFRHVKNGNGPIEALHVVPHLDPGHPRLVLDMRHTETAEEALVRLGLTVRAVADPGAPLLHFPRPRSRSETSNA